MRKAEIMGSRRRKVEDEPSISQTLRLQTLLSPSPFFPLLLRDKVTWGKQMASLGMIP